MTSSATFGCARAKAAGTPERCVVAKTSGVPSRTLAASASYIAAPAAVRLALPEANPSYYLTCSLALTFPFNIVLGLPLYRAMAEALYR